MIRIIQKTQGVIVIAVLIIYLSLVMIPSSIILSFFSLKIKLSVIGPMWSLFSRILIKYALRAELNIIDRRDQLEKNQAVAGSLYIANHMSFMDIPLIGTTIQLPPIMKKEVLYIPVFGMIGWLGGCLIVDRSKGASRKKIFFRAKKRILKERVGLQFYPEGTRSRSGRPKEFDQIKRAILAFAYQEKIPIYPISVHGTDKIFKDTNLLNLNQKLSVIFHGKINPADFKESIEFEKFCWGKVTGGFDEVELLQKP